jgi:hypothetical protein
MAPAAALAFAFVAAALSLPSPGEACCQQSFPRDPTCNWLRDFVFLINHSGTTPNCKRDTPALQSSSRPLSRPLFCSRHLLLLCCGRSWPLCCCYRMNVDSAAPQAANTRRPASPSPSPDEEPRKRRNEYELGKLAESEKCSVVVVVVLFALSPVLMCGP